MAETKIANIIVPSVFNPYVIEKTTEMSNLVQSGIVETDPLFDTLATAGGKLINVPFFKELTGADQVLSDSASLTVNNVASGQDVARLHTRGNAWGVNDLAKALSGDDPMEAIATMVAAYWVHREQDLLISSLKGVFADNLANDSGDLISNIAIEAGNSATDANKMGGEAIINASAKLGDAAGGLTAICMHSVPYTRLRLLNLIDWIAIGTARAENGFTREGMAPTFDGKRIIVDDSCPVVAGSTNGFKYTSYLFGQGAVARGEGAAPVPTETDRDSLAGSDILVNRRHFILHPRGVKWTETTVTGVAPTNAQCELAVNWDRVYSKKNVRIVQLVTNG